MDSEQDTFLISTRRASADESAPALGSLLEAVRSAGGTVVQVSGVPAPSRAVVKLPARVAADLHARYSQWYFIEKDEPLSLG